MKSKVILKQMLGESDVRLVEHEKGYTVFATKNGYESEIECSSYSEAIDSYNHCSRVYMESYLNIIKASEEAKRKSEAKRPTMRDAVDMFRATGKKVTFVTADGEDISLAAWETHMEYYQVLDSPIGNCKWTIRFEEN